MGLDRNHVPDWGDTSHCQMFFSLSEGTLGTDALACSWPRGLRKYAFPPVSLLAQTLCKVREDEEQVLLVAPYWPNRTWFPELMLLATAPLWQIPLRRDLLSQRGGTLWRGASIADICKAAGWATPNTFARFYNLRIEPVSSRVLVSDGQ